MAEKGRGLLKNIFPRVSEGKIFTYMRAQHFIHTTFDLWTVAPLYARFFVGIFVMQNKIALDEVSTRN